MPRSPGGEYTLPAGQPAVPDTLITADVHNSFANDVAATLEDSLSRSGKGGMLVPFRVLDGSEYEPSYSFTSNTGMGIFLLGGNSLEFVVNRNTVMSLQSDRLESRQQIIAPRATVTSETPATPTASTNALTVGNKNRENVKFDPQSIQSVNNGVAANLNINQHGGAVIVNGKEVGIKDEYYQTTEFIKTSNGAPDAGKPILLDNEGKISATMVDAKVFYFVDGFTPRSNAEYPDVTDHGAGALWVLENLTVPYTFNTGDLAGQTGSDGYYMVYGTDGWLLMEGNLNPAAYYRIDGTKAITAPFAGGNQRLSNIADGVADNDAATVGQISTVGDFLPIDGKAVDSDKLDGVDSAGFLRSDADTVKSSGTLKISDASALIIGDSDLLTIGVDGANAEIKIHDGANLILSNQAGDEQIGFSNTGNIDIQGEYRVNGVPISGDFYDKTEFINVSAGAGDAGKPIVLSSLGKVDPSMIGEGSLYLVGNFTPTAGTEYPDTTGETHGAFWSVTGLASPYTFVGGDLAGQTIDNGQYMAWGSAAWTIMGSVLDPTAFYKLDGTVAIIAPFAGGGHLISSIADGVANTDAATVGQLAGKLDTGGKAADTTLFDGDSKSTFLRTTGDQNIAGNLKINGTESKFTLAATDAPANEVNWVFDAYNTGQFSISAYNDALDSHVPFFVVERSAEVIDSVDVIAPAINLDGAVNAYSAIIGGATLLNANTDGVVNLTVATVDKAATEDAINVTRDGTSVAAITAAGDLRCGAIAATGAIVSQDNVTAYSDRRIKKNLEVIGDPLMKVAALTGYTFDRIDIDTDRQTGLIAQDVQNVLPEAVMEAEDGTLSVAYGNIVGLLVEAIKELQEQVRQLKERV